MLTNLPPWEQLLKKILWKQLGNIQGKRILDFGSGIGVTADYLAQNNSVVAVEPSQENVQGRRKNHGYQQLVGSTDILKQLDDNSFDLILCHNVLEYAPDRAQIVKEFSRLLKPDGQLSVVKHNRAGRVMQMVVLLNDFSKAHALLDGADGSSAQFGTIHYYEDEEVVEWCDAFEISSVRGIRAFWDLQQNQEIHKDIAWQDQMVEVEMRVADMDAFRNVAFFHHLILVKKSI